MYARRQPGGYRSWWWWKTSRHQVAVIRGIASKARIHPGLRRRPDHRAEGRQTTSARILKVVKLVAIGISLNLRTKS